MAHGKSDDSSSTAHPPDAEIEAMRTSLRNFVSCITLAPLSIAMFDREMRYLAASALWSQDYGRGYSDLIGRSHYDVLPDLPERWKEFHRRGLAGETIKNDEDLWAQADGTLHWLRWTVTPWRDTHGAVGGIMITTENITERKHAEEALREQERMLSESQRMAHLGSWSVQLATGKITWSAEAYRIYGVTPETFTHDIKDYFNFVHPDDHAATHRQYELLMSGTQLHEHEFRIIRPDGAVRTIVGIGSVRLDADHRPVELVGTVQDITERKNIEQQLAASESLLRTIVDTEPACIKLIAADCKLLEINAAGLDMIEAETRDHVIGQNMAQLVIPEHRDAFTALQQRVIGGAGGTLEFDVVGLKGTRRTLETHAVPLRDASGKVIAALGLTSDITERKRMQTERAKLERQLQQAQKMEALGQLTAGIAHDFNNILASVLGYTELALELCVTDKNSKLADYLGVVQTAGFRARDLISNMLAFSRSGEVERQAVLPGILAHEVARALAPALASSIEFKTRIESDGLSVHANPVQLHQVIMNLVINARDAVGEHGRIELAVRAARDVNATCASCHDHVVGDFIEIAVSDNGPGMTPDLLTRVFDPFFTTKDTGKGTGMGLSVVHGIVHSHGGHMLVQSAPGAGTLMRALLPLATPATAFGTDVAGAVRNMQSGTTRILVVDDEEMLAQLFGEALQAHGYQVTVCSDSRKALEQFRAAPCEFDAVISDQTMPGLTGTELTHALRELRPELPVILCTGYSAVLNEQVATQLKVALLTKPVSIKTLLLMLEKVLIAQ